MSPSDAAGRRHEPLSAREAAGAMAVFAWYGRVMLLVQTFELQLAMFALLASVEDAHHTTPAADAKEAALKAVMGMFRAGRSGGAGRSKHSLRRYLGDKLDDDLLEDLDRAVAWRNRLAHRYLREKFYERRTFPPGTIGELNELAQVFEGLGRRLAKEMQRLTAAWAMDTPPPSIIAWLEEASDLILSGGPESGTGRATA